VPSESRLFALSKNRLVLSSVKLVPSEKTMEPAVKDEAPVPPFVTVRVPVVSLSAILKVEVAVFTQLAPSY